VNDNGHGQRFVMCLFVSCYHFSLVAKGSEGEREQSCMLLCKSPTGETQLLPLYEGEEEWSKNQRRQGGRGGSSGGRAIEWGKRRSEADWAGAERRT